MLTAVVAFSDADRKLRRASTRAWLPFVVADDPTLLVADAVLVLYLVCNSHARMPTQTYAPPTPFCGLVIFTHRKLQPKALLSCVSVCLSLLLALRSRSRRSSRSKRGTSPPACLGWRDTCCSETPRRVSARRSYLLLSNTWSRLSRTDLQTTRS